MNTKRIPIKAAKEISEKFGQDQVIIISWDKSNNRSHVITYGKTVVDCEQAAQGGNKLKKVLGYPDEMCNSVPTRVRRKTLKSAGLQPTTRKAKNG